MNFKKEYTDLISHYGVKHQKAKAIEEMAELSTLVARTLGERKITSDEALDEMADVSVMLDQLMLMWDISEEKLKAKKEAKIKRALSRMSEQKTYFVDYDDKEHIGRIDDNGVMWLREIHSQHYIPVYDFDKSRVREMYLLGDYEY